MPELGEGAPEGHLLRWLFRVGDRVEKGATIAELETVKVNVDVVAPESGVLQAIVCGEGSIVRAGMVLGHVGTGEGASARPAAAAPAPTEHAARVERAGAERDAARCRYCATLVVHGRVDCVKCGAPL